MTGDELVGACRALLAEGFVTGDAATVVRRHRRDIAELFREEFGWHVVAEDHGPVRALRQPGVAHVARGLRTRSGRPFDPRRYTLLFLVLAGLEAAGGRTTLTVLFDDVSSRAGDVDGFDFDRNVGAHRRAFVHAVQAIVDLGVLELADGDERAFARTGDGDALYRVNRPHLTRLLATSKPPSLAATAADAVAETYTHTDDGQRRARRHRLTRTLVSEPVLYRDDLTDAELEYLTGQEPRLRKLLRHRFGLTLETRAEGWVAVDEAGSLTSLTFPTISAASAAALAVVDASRARLDPGTGTAPWPTPDLHAFVGGLGARFGTSWTVAADDADGIAAVTEDAVRILTAMRLADRGANGIVVRAAAGRFAIPAPAAGATTPNAPDLLDPAVEGAP